jgi:hypothetical protein
MYDCHYDCMVCLICNWDGRLSPNIHVERMNRQDCWIATVRYCIFQALIGNGIFSLCVRRAAGSVLLICPIDSTIQLKSCCDCVIVKVSLLGHVTTD